jgi:hypothetical protein
MFHVCVLQVYVRLNMRKQHLAGEQVIGSTPGNDVPTAAPHGRVEAMPTIPAQGCTLEVYFNTDVHKLHK